MNIEGVMSKVKVEILDNISTTRTEPVVYSLDKSGFTVVGGRRVVG